MAAKVDRRETGIGNNSVEWELIVWNVTLFLLCRKFSHSMSILQRLFPLNTHFWRVNSFTGFYLMWSTNKINDFNEICECIYKWYCTNVKCIMPSRLTWMKSRYRPICFIFTKNQCVGIFSAIVNGRIHFNNVSYR